MNLKNQKQIQENQYNFPYHYIPEIKKGNFYNVKYWSWGFRYLGGMQVVFDQLKKIKFSSLIDIGCGDGRFLSELVKVYPNINILGVDYSKRAISLAKAMNPEISSCFLKKDIITQKISNSYDVATLIEVIEHINPGKIELFIRAITGLLKVKGYLIITVPHKNKSVQIKHYQHFNFFELRNMLSPYFENFVFIPFDRKTKILSLMQKIIGGEGINFILTNSKILAWFYDTYKRKYLYVNDERSCMRLGVVCKKK